MKYEFPIPPAYVEITKGYERRGIIFKQYVEGYIKRTYPEFELKKIEGMKAICERK